MNRGDEDLFSVRRRIRRWKSFSGIFHLATVCGLALCLVWTVPQMGAKSALQVGIEMKQEQQRRQLLLEALDKLARYEKHFNEVNGRYARDLARLGLPERFSSGDFETLTRNYELSVLEARPNRFLLLATGINNSDRVTIDESHRVNANFVLPAPTRSYLLEEADRSLRLRAYGRPEEPGLVGRYWSLRPEEGGRGWVAVGLRVPVLGERRELAAGADEPESLFSAVREKVANRLLTTSSDRERDLASVDGAGGNFKEMLTAADASEWLEAARLAQHVHLREFGHYARRWEELDESSNYRFAQRIKAVKNVRVHPIELLPKDFHLVLEGTIGELQGEQFMMDARGAVRQVRYTETLIQQLNETTNILENFQINPITDEHAPRP